ncbi:MAG TPA: hypothetical protein PLT76_08610 [Candidatus Omnitrophota bacterium]|nr:hypothetical protein [Candidatus Omnitrophota bacterium]HQO58763.1 hypothetical protein [Candidatus Omnitrophota bacterium]HQP11449.1 hypothetical protein [Candidatus Omnitrophota bacterium]
MSTGIYIYERHLADQGRIGPVGQLIDFVRFGKYAEDRTRTSKTAGEEEAVNIQEHLSRLQETYDALYKERDALSKKRQEILAELLTLNERLLKEAGTYAEVLSQEQYRFLEEFPELKEVAAQMARAYMTEDPEDRSRQLLKAEQRMEELFKEEEGGAADAGAQRLKNHLRNILTVIRERYPDQFQSFCEKADPAECLNKDPEQAGALVQKVLLAGGEGLATEMDDLKALIASLSREYYLAEENYTASEQLLEQQNQRIEGDLRKLSTQLVEATDLGVEEINALYKDLLFEYDVILENLALNLRRMEEKQNRLEWQINHAQSLSSPHGSASPGPGASPLAAIKKQQEDLLRLLDENLQASKETYQQQRNLGTNFARAVRENLAAVSLDPVRGAASPDPLRPGSRVEYNNRQPVAQSNRPSRPGSRVEYTNRQPVAQSNRPSTASASIQQKNYTVQDTRAMLDSAAERNSDISTRAREQMQRLRDKAKDQGFYDRAFPSSLYR